MDLSNAQILKSISDPIQMPVSELLSATYNFSIPSYQRGYRWEASEHDSLDENKQVDDLLNDLTSFVDSNTRNTANYYLQPLMVKPKIENGQLVWDVLDGQQRLTTMLLILLCIKEKLKLNFNLYSIDYENRPDIDFGKITFDTLSPNYDYPKANSNLDSFYVRKAKDRIERWYKNEIETKQQRQDDLKKALFYEDSSRNGASLPTLRVLFIWYNVEPVAIKEDDTNSRIHDIEVFNRLNRGKISLTNSELIKALFVLCIERSGSSSSLLSLDSLSREWDSMGKRFQDETFWSVFCKKETTYQNRLDLLFDFICESDSIATEKNAYRYYCAKLKPISEMPDIQKLEDLWEDVKKHFDKLCKWFENPSYHNRIGFLVDCGVSVASINKELSTGSSLDEILEKSIKKQIEKKGDKLSEDDLDSLNYHEDGNLIRKILLLFNVITCDKFEQKFPFDKYRSNSYDIEHVNSQTDNPIEKLDDKKDWITNQALPCLKEEYEEKDNAGNVIYTNKQAQDLINRGNQLLDDFKKNGKDSNDGFKSYRQNVESFYAYGDANTIESPDRDSIGNLTLLNSNINREYKNALFPKKVRTIKRGDQEGAYIPLCTKYLFLKYYTNRMKYSSAFNMMRWREDDQKDYIKSIKFTLKSYLS